MLVKSSSSRSRPVCNSRIQPHPATSGIGVHAPAGESPGLGVRMPVEVLGLGEDKPAGQTPHSKAMARTCRPGPSVIAGASIGPANLGLSVTLHHAHSPGYAPSHTPLPWLISTPVRQSGVENHTVIRLAGSNHILATTREDFPERDPTEGLRTRAPGSRGTGALVASRHQWAHMTAPICHGENSSSP
jgi:hypothetical protein